MSSRERSGFLWILFAAFCFAFMPPMVRATYLHTSFEPMDIAIWRFVLATPLMWILVFISRRATRKPRPSDVPVSKVLIVGFIMAFAVLAAFFALERLPASTYIVLFYSYPAMVVVLSLALGESIGLKSWLALALAMIGVALTVPDFSMAGNGDLVGVALALLNAAIVAVYYLAAKRVMMGVADVSGSSAWMMLGALALFVLLLPLRGLQLPPNPAAWLLLIGIAVFGTVLPIYAINMAIQRIGAAQASLVSTVEPILSMIISMLLLSEVIYVIQWVGAALIVGSVIVLQLRPRNQIDISIAHEAG